MTRLHGTDDDGVVRTILYCATCPPDEEPDPYADDVSRHLYGIDGHRIPPGWNNPRSGNHHAPLTEPESFIVLDAEWTVDRLNELDARLKALEAKS